MSKHTPTPWKFQGEITVSDGLRRQKHELYTASGKFGHPATCDLEADAEFIVRAVNAHDELVAALRPIAAAYRNDPGTSDLYDEQPVTIPLGDVRRAWAALAKAEGK